MSTRPCTLLLMLSVMACTHAGVHSATQARVPPFDALEDAPPATRRELDLRRLKGRWYVLATNFEFWSKCGRTDPSFVYAVIEHPDVGKLADVVHFRQRGRTRRFEGVDVQDPSREGHWQWRGDGILHGIVNQWFVVLLDPEEQWAVIYFSESNLGTGSGLEIIARDRDLSDDTIAHIVGLIEADPDLRRRARGMYTPEHNGTVRSLALPSPSRSP